MILAIDPGLINIGYSIYDHNESSIIVSSELSIKEKALIDRLRISCNFFMELFDNYQFHTFLYEQPTFNSRGNTGQHINFNLGTIISLAAINQCTIKSFSPKEVKKLVSGNGNADKNVVAESVSKFFKIDNDFTSNHASDSLAVLMSYLKNS